MLKYPPRACVSVLFATSGAPVAPGPRSSTSTRPATTAPTRRSAQFHQGHRHQDQSGGLGRCRHSRPTEGRGFGVPRRRDPAGGCRALPYRGEVDGLRSNLIRSTGVSEDAIPANLRRQAGSGRWIAWFGFSTRARIVVYDKISSQARVMSTLAKARRSAQQGQDSHPLGLAPLQPEPPFGAITEHLAKPKQRNGCATQGQLALLAQGCDTDQTWRRSLGECQIAVTNSYFARMMRAVRGQGWVTERLASFPNQAPMGTHLNIAGGAVARHAAEPGQRGQVPEYFGQPASAPEPPTATTNG